MSRIFQSIPIKISLCIFVIETVILALVGVCFLNLIDDIIDSRVAEKLKVPSHLISQSALSTESIRDRAILSKLLDLDIAMAFLVQPDGVISHSTDPELVGAHYLNQLSREEQRDFSPVGKKHVQTTFTDAQGNSVISALSPVVSGDKHSAGLYLRITDDTLLVLRNAIARAFIGGAAVAVLIVTLVLTIIVNRMVVPRIARTSAVLRRIANGDFSARIAHSGSRDQLGQMMEQVNLMISTIQQYTRTLQILNTAAEEFAQARSKDEIIQQVTELIEQHLPVRREGKAGSYSGTESGGVKAETVFTIPITDDDQNYQVLGFVAEPGYEPLTNVERDFVETLSRMLNVTTDRINAFQDISNAEARYRQLFTSALEGILRTRPEGGIIEANPALAIMTGYDSVDEMIEQVKHIGQQFYVDPLDFEQLKAQLETEERILDREVRFKRKDGTLFPVSVSAYAVRDDAGRLEAFDIRLFNIAERKRREQAERDHMAAEAVSIAKSKLVEDLEWKNRQLVEALNELKSTQLQLMQSEKMAAVGATASGVAHDLNNILAGIASYPELLLDSLPEESEMRPLLEAIQDSGRRSAEIVADLLTLSQGVVKEKKRLSLESVIGDCIQAAEFSKMIEEFPDVVLSTEFSEQQTQVLCSNAHLQKALICLVKNSVEAMNGSGHITLLTESVRSHSGVDSSGEETFDTFAVLRVIDDGPGIPQENIRHIFEPFYTRKVMGMSGGSGLGLTVVWNVVNEHGGRVEVESAEDGTTFSLYFPVVDGTVAEPEEGGSKGEELHGKGRILVVDDEPLQRDIALKMLTRFGYEVVCCRSGEEAVQFLENETVDLLLLDMLMPPGMNGLETYRRILELHPDQKAVIVSGYSENKDVKRAMQLGAGSFIKKPYTMHQVAQSVKSELEAVRE